MSMLHICFQLSISGGVSAKINSIIQIPGPSYIIRYIFIYIYIYIYIYQLNIYIYISIEYTCVYIYIYRWNQHVSNGTWATFRRVLSAGWGKGTSEEGNAAGTSWRVWPPRKQLHQTFAKCTNDVQLLGTKVGVPAANNVQGAVMCPTGSFFCISTDWLRICQEGALWPLIHRIIWLWTWRIPASQIFGDLKSQKVVGETGRLGNLEGQRPKGWGGLGCLPPWIGISWYIWYAHICSMFGQTHIVSPFDEYRCSWSSFKR